MFECGGYRAKKAFTVKQKAHSFNILAIQYRFYWYLQLVPAINLRPAHKSWLYIVRVILVPLGYKVDLIP